MTKGELFLESRSLAIILMILVSGCSVKSCCVAKAVDDRILDDSSGDDPVFVANSNTPGPSLTSITPNSGPYTGGTSVIVTGARIGLGSPVITVGGNLVTNLSVIDSNTISCNVPAGLPGPANVIVSNRYGQSTLQDGYKYIGPDQDVNGDGIPDVVVGAQWWGGQTGRVYVFFGGPSLASKLAGAADIIFSGEAGGDKFGQGISLGDLNNDGISDILVGAAYNDNDGVNAGRAYIFHGGSGLVSKGAGLADVIMSPEAAGDQLGYRVNGGDVNGDGFRDVLVCAIGHDSGGADSGRSYVIYGHSGGFTSGSVAAADVKLDGEAAGDNFGTHLSSGDVTGDGFEDVLVGARFNGAAGVEAGRAYVFTGGPTLVSAGAAAATVILTAEAAGDRFGTRVVAGDVNEDGTLDVLVGANLNDAAGLNAGRAYIFFGGAGLISQGAATADIILTGENLNDRLGPRIEVHDISGDGTNDVVVGASMAGVGGPGRCYVFKGGAGLVSKNAAAADIIIEGEAAADSLGGGAHGRCRQQWTD